MKQLTREEKISEIYEKIANKKLSFGCRFVVNDLPIDLYVRQQNGIIYGRYMEYYNSKGLKIIGHPVMIGDVLDWAYNIAKDKGINIKELIGLWKHKRNPIKEQSKECIDYIYNLLEND